MVILMTPTRFIALPLFVSSSLLAFMASVGCPTPNNPDGGDPADSGNADDGGILDAGNNGGTLTAQGEACANLVINEVMARNDTIIADENNEFDDWIEIYNTSDDNIELSSCAMSDNASNLSAFVFAGDTIITGKGFLQFWADDTPEQGPIHAGFKLSGNGDTLIISGKNVDGGFTQVSTVTFPVQEIDVSFGLFPDGEGELKALSTATPGLPNTAAR